MVRACKRQNRCLSRANTAEGLAQDRWFLLDDLMHRLPQRRNLGLHNVPHQLVIDTKIIVDQPVSGASHLPPLNLRISCTEIIRNLLDRLTDYFEAPDKGSSGSRH